MSATTVDELQVIITANTQHLQEQINNANKQIEKLKKKATKSTGGVLDAFKKLKTGIVALGIGKVITDAIQSGMDAIESDSLFETVMGDNYDAVKAWSNTVADTLGLNAIAMQKNIGVIYNMTSSMGVAGDNALKMSKGISVLAEDMASFYNLDSAEAFNKLRAGLTGETEPLKALGILVDENTVKQVAYSEGIATVGSELTQQQKVLARYVAILRQTNTAQGDLARTITSPSNQLRSLKQSVTSLGIAFSNILMPVVQAVLPWLNALTKVATQAVNSIASLLGVSGGGLSDDTKKASENTGGISSNLDDANNSAKKLKKSLAGFDEMNVLSDNSADDSAGASTAGAVSIPLGFDLSEYDAHLDWVESDVNALAERIKTKFTELFGSIDFTNFMTSLDGLKQSLAPLVENVGTGLGWFVQNVLVPIAGWVVEDVVPEFLDLLGGAIDIVNQAIEDIKPIFSWFWDNVLSPIAEWTGGVFVAVLNGIGDALKWIADNKIAMTILESLAVAIGLVAAAIGIYNVVMGICNIVTGAFASIMAVLTSPITLVVLAIAAVIAIIALCVEYWDEIKAAAAACWDWIKNAWNSAATWFNEKIVQPIAGFFSGLWNGFKDGAKKAWDGIKSVFSAVGGFFKDVFSKAWKGIVSVFSTAGEIFVNIKDGIVSVFKTVVNGIIKGINAVIKLPFEGFNKVLETIHGISILGVSPFGWLTWRAPIPQIPELARGGIVDRPTYAMIGEAGTEAVIPMERNLGALEKLSGMIAEKIGGVGGDIHLTVKLGEDTIFDKFIEYSREKAFETNGEVVFA
ncbi:MAG: hypothetical protein IKW46_07485 [Bacteroidaceae bacterium]|nr:hypothetical protein [Bacteroidaceae bacterium]